MVLPQPLYLQFDRAGWAAFRAEAPMPLTEAEAEGLRGQLAAVSMAEVETIYLPLARLISLYVQANQQLFRVTGQFLGHPAAKVPFVIGIAGSVAVGKSTTSRVLRALLARTWGHRRVDIITTDGYLFANAVLETRGLTMRKGFPESYDLTALVATLADLKAGTNPVEVPVYSHYHYDVVADRTQTVAQPDIVLVEGINILQPPSAAGSFGPSVSDFLDFSIYVDAEEAVLKAWYLERFMLFRRQALGDPQAFFHRFAAMSEAEAERFAAGIWHDVNERNLRDNILPTRERARLILGKGPDHRVERVSLRRI